MDQTQTNILRENRVNIVQDLEPKGTVLDSLYEDGILTENDVELVSSAKTRKERVQALLSILPTRGPVAYGSFQKALEVGQYDDLVKLLAPVKHTNVQLDDLKFISGSCPPCFEFLEWLESSKKKKNITLKKLLRWQCCLFLDNIEPKDIIDQLFQDHVINMDDIDKISSRATRRERCEKLFKLLLENTNSTVTNALKRALTKKYSYIADEFSKGETEAGMTSQSRGRLPNDGKSGDSIRKSRGETKPKVFVEDSSDENECLREIEELNASTFGVSMELVTKSFEEETKNKITETVFRGELEQIRTHSFDPNINYGSKESMSNATAGEDLKVVRRSAKSEQRSSNDIGDDSKLSTKNTRPKMIQSENIEATKCRREIEERSASETMETVNKHVQITQQSFSVEGEIADIVRPRQIEERTASTCFTMLIDETRPKQVIAKNNDAVREIEERSTSTLGEHAELVNKYYECTLLKEVVGEKMVEHAWSGEIEDRYADTVCEKSKNHNSKTNCETQPKAILVGNRNVDNLTREIDDQNVSVCVIAIDESKRKEFIAEGREIEERSASSFDSMDETAEKLKFLDDDPITQSSTSFERKSPLSGDICHNFDYVDSAISERRLKVITLDNNVQPMKSEIAEQRDNNNKDSKSCLICTTSVSDTIPVVDSENTQNSQQEHANDVTHQSKELMPLSVTATHTEKPRKRLTVAFNYLSTLINQGEFTKFQDLSGRLQKQFPANYDLMCIIGYLQTSRDLFQTNFDSAKRNIDATMALVPKTSNPRYFTLELFTAKTRMYITRKKLEKLQTTLDEAMMILETDPVGCTGRAAGWLYINHARNQTAQLTCLNLSKQTALGTYERLFLSAKSSFQRSMSNFKRDGGKDGPFGFGYALCRLVILLLRCGDNGLTMDTITPPADDLRSSGQYIQHLEDSDIVIPKILDMHFRLAKCDYQFRRQNYIRAFEHAQIAYDLATEMNLLEFKEHAHNRLAHLKSKTSAIPTDNEMSDEEVEDLLFGESSDNDYNSHSE